MRASRDKEIFKKERLPIHELDAESFDGVNEMDKVHQAKQEKHVTHYKHKDTCSPKIKDNLKHKGKRDKNRKSNKNCEEKFLQVEKTNKRKSFITKNRLTRSIGIYNKGKKSETIYREQRKSRFFNKVSDRLKEKTNKDISKVLDCSSFQIKPLYAACQESTMCDYNYGQHDNSPDSSSYYSDQNNQFGPASTSISRSPVNDKDPSPGTMSSEVPLEEIEQELVNNMKPLQIFKRDYLKEIRDELKDYYWKSRTLNQCEGEIDQSPDPNLTKTPVFPGSTCNIVSKRKLFMSSIGKDIARQNVDIRDSENQKIQMENEKRKKENIRPGVHAQIILQNEQPDTLSRSSQTIYQPVSTHMDLSVNDEQGYNFDILSILDEDLRCTDEVGVLGIQSPVYSDISPLKKPSLEIASPPGKLYPRKLF